MTFDKPSHEALKPRFRPDGTRLINGRQVNLLIAMGITANKRGSALLEFIEYECGVLVDRLEDIKDGPELQRIVRKLQGE